MNNQEIVTKTAEFVKKKFEGDGSAHDWWHILRVWQLAKKIGEKEKADLFVVELAALLHDVADWKFQEGGDDSIGAKVSKEWLESLNVDKKIISQVCDTVTNLSFKGTDVKNKINTLEGEVVQDADRLDAIGAIGIARCFAYDGSKGKPMYDPKRKPIKHSSFEEYKNSNAPSITHFYEKLLLLKDRMNTETGRKIAQKRHDFMILYLEQFFKEWNGKE